jgi:hypothetical protein
MKIEVDSRLSAAEGRGRYFVCGTAAACHNTEPPIPEGLGSLQSAQLS